MPAGSPNSCLSRLPSISGLALFLDADRRTLLRWSKDPNLVRSNLIVAAKARIEAALERALFIIPDPRRAVTGAGDDAPAVGREGDAQHPVLMAQDGSVRRNRLETGRARVWRSAMTKRSPFRYFKTSPDIIRLAGQCQRESA